MGDLLDASSQVGLSGHCVFLTLSFGVGEMQMLKWNHCMPQAFLFASGVKVYVCLNVWYVMYAGVYCTRRGSDSSNRHKRAQNKSSVVHCWLIKNPHNYNFWRGVANLLNEVEQWLSHCLLGILFSHVKTNCAEESRSVHLQLSIWLRLLETKRNLIKAIRLYLRTNLAFLPKASWSFYCFQILQFSFSCSVALAPFDKQLFSTLLSVRECQCPYMLVHKSIL